MYVLFKVVINVRLEFVDFDSGSLEVSIEEAESYEFYTEDSFEKKAEELFTHIIQNWNRWISYDFCMNERLL